MQTDRIFVHNRIGLLASMNLCGKKEDNAEPRFVPRSPSPTDSEEDKGYKSMGRCASSDGTLPPTPARTAASSDSDCCMGPPGSFAVPKRRLGKGAPLPFCADPWVTSTPNVDSTQSKLVSGHKLPILPLKGGREEKNLHNSVDWDSEEDEVAVFSPLPPSKSKNTCCDEELCCCNPELKFSFAINCEDTASIAHSTFSEGNGPNSPLPESVSFGDYDEPVLSGDRLSQMTRTYHDIEAVTHLLEEKERDLELAARIGQTLLQKNREIAHRNEQLEEQLAVVIEEASQLRHEISLKEDLLNIYADDDTDSSGAPSPVKELRNYGRSGMYTHIEGLQARIQKLEAENAKLREERVQLEEKSEGLESQEQRLVSDTVKELASLRKELKEANDNIHMLTEELSQRNEESAKQQEEITRLLTQIVDMQRKQKHLALENEEFQQHLTAANSTQYELTKEIQSLEDRYQEVTHMLEETREEARHLREYPEQFGTSVPFGDSLAAELECGGDMQADFGIQSSPHSFYNPSSTSIQWSSPPSSVTGEHEEEDEKPALHSGDIVTNDRITQSEPRLRRRGDDSFGQHILNTTRFVNNVKDLSMKPRFQHVTPRKRDRPIPTPLAIPGSNRSPLFIHASPDSTPSSGHKCMSSTPCDSRKQFNRLSSLHKSNDLSGIVTPVSKPATPNHSCHRPVSLRLQLANKKLAQRAPGSFVDSNLSSGSAPPVANGTPLRSSFKPFPDPQYPLGFLSVMSSLMRTRSKRAYHSWHGETTEDVADALKSQSGFATPSLGRPGVPGTEDLERAIRKLELRREGARYMEMEKRLAMKDGESFSSFDNSDSIATPGSSMPSVGQTPPPSRPTTPRFGNRSITARLFPTPKLRIVKPLEGSVTLNQWKYLADRDRLHTALQPNTHLPSGVLTREQAAEVLSRSREASTSEDRSPKPSSDTSLSVSHTKSKSSLNNTSDNFLNVATLHSPTVASPAERSHTVTAGVPYTSDDKSHQELKRPSKKVTHEVHGLWNNFASTATRHTFTDCRVQNPNNDKNEAPACSKTEVTATMCNVAPSGQKAVTTASVACSGSTGSYMFAVHPFLSSQPRKSTPGERAEQFFKDNTRTCSMELGMAHLLKEHAVKPTDLKVSVTESPKAVDSNDAAPKETRPQTIGGGVGSAFTKNMLGGGHIVWNRSLQRTFLLPSQPKASDFFFNINSRSKPKNPETPPNSPLSAAPPTSASYLLNEILSEAPPADLQVEKKEEGGTFSANLLSKLAQIGITGLPGFRSTSKTTAQSVSARRRPKLSYSTPSSKDTKVASSAESMLSKSATAPGSLLVGGREALPFATPNGGFDVDSAATCRLSGERADGGSAKDEGLQMKTTNTDWADLHGSSGALNAPLSRMAQAGDSDCESAGASAMSESPLRVGRPPEDSSTPKGENEIAASASSEAASPVIPPARNLPSRGRSSSSVSARPKTFKTNRKK